MWYNSGSKLRAADLWGEVDPLALGRLALKAAT